MKHRTEIIRAIAALTDEDKTPTPARIRQRTLIPEAAIKTALAEMEREGLIEVDGGIWLTCEGFDQYRREMPRRVDPSLLLSHCNES